MRVVAYIVALLMLGACTPQTSDSASKKSDSASSTRWSYGQHADQMRGTTSYGAEVENSGVPVKLFFWKNADGNSDVYFQAEAEHTVVSCLPGFGRPLSVKFDDGPVEELECSHAMDDSNTLFIKDSDRFIERIRGAKRLMLELELIEGPAQQFTLDVTGLQWPPPGWSRSATNMGR